MLLLDDHWTWDFWTTRDRDVYHLFYLKAPKSLGDPDLRHVNARVGHATSTDLRTWSELPDALGPGAVGSWDDLATWTGSVLEESGTWYMFYTGVDRRDGGATQRIGVATSDDLVTWTKHPEPVLTLDERWYQGRVPGWESIDWRDPWVYWSPEHGEHRMLLTARGTAGTVDERGVIGRARARTLLDWEAIPPALAPREFGHMEVPQLVEERGTWYLSYSVYGDQHSHRRLRRAARETGTHYVMGPSEDGPWSSPGDRFLCGGDGELYAGRFERDPDGRLVFLAFLQWVDGGPFVGGLSDPIPVLVETDGTLRLERSAIDLPAAASVPAS
ncbi:beta-fructofuranosidase [Salana multivorans]|uniref:beta-fructofuranosidase n=1 Tax=Salana multivorans TaxID=120377 RepID=A0A3N2DAF0_9MICO|nr:family 43 glycosylhydrolase [Salana multivorans]ROR96759.1 beta-fructofuranosidase [Salana multivorans]